MSRDARDRLEDMLSCADAIKRLVEGVTFDAYEATEEKRFAVERLIFIIGEAAARLPAHRRRDDSPVPWHSVIGPRNILAHGYWTVEHEEMWEVATVHVPALATHVRSLLDEES
jgi:uncharacterized protein with HEPN domain